MVGSGLHPHVWYAASGDIFRRNIVWRDYQPALMPAPPWGQDMDYNLVHRDGADERPRDHGCSSKAAATNIPSWPTRSSLIPPRATTA